MNEPVARMGGGKRSRTRSCSLRPRRSPCVDAMAAAPSHEFDELGELRASLCIFRVEVGRDPGRAAVICGGAEIFQVEYMLSIVNDMAESTSPWHCRTLTDNARPHRVKSNDTLAVGDCSVKGGFAWSAMACLRAAKGRGRSRAFPLRAHQVS
ncbi:hypothetical protein OH76DRAFT_1170417 [Lentinus brumalis]|uniref:Uncharacterized protein n=1 Tax=Lentinus brumalis TaxID=2498619 RepID=A0A371CUB0_9APHY|nr:hypothetical protein OH76DRAFT_1170417 [Polyporus brumalis]